MGCDIHLYVERRTPEGRWENIDPPKPPDQSDPKYYWHLGRNWDWRLGEGEEPEAMSWAVHRNYILFGVLAGVRDWEVRPIHPPRGIPDDLSPEVAASWRRGGDHTPTWYTLEELLQHDWDQRYPSGYDTDDTQHYFCQQFCDHLLPELARLGSPKDIRVVLWFDS